MTLSFKDRFWRACLPLAPSQQATVFRVVLELKAALQRPHEHTGLGLRKVHPSGLWKIRIGLSLRAVFALTHDTATFIFLGTYNEVQRFLKSL